MSGIVGQADQYAAFDNTPRPERVAYEAPAEIVAEFTRGRSVGTGMLNPAGIKRQHFAGWDEAMRDEDRRDRDWRRENPEAAANKDFHEFARTPYSSERHAGWENDYGRPGPLEPPEAFHDTSLEEERAREELEHHFGHDPHQHIPESEVYGSGSYGPEGHYDDYDHGLSDFG